MIGKISGITISRSQHSCIIDVNGIGYIVNCTPATLSLLKEEEKTSIFTYLAVRENAMELFGFVEERELGLFKLLLDVPGIGPRSALGVIAIAPVQMMISAIHAGDSTYLTKVSGIGKKSAEKIVLELKDKVANLIDSNSKDTISHFRSDDIDVLEAITTLGYSQQQGKDALSSIDENIVGVQKRLTAALKYLGR